MKFAKLDMEGLSRAQLRSPQMYIDASQKSQVHFLVPLLSTLELGVYALLWEVHCDDHLNLATSSGSDCITYRNRLGFRGEALCKTPFT